MHTQGQVLIFEKRILIGVFGLAIMDEITVVNVKPQLVT